ncbi:oligosaccharide flippase family protein [Pyrococcus furiosus]|uniref:oligosaccharide flippase family protein n=1 Tax=Pyrococcus furiosus TaxID=2261 RepID=UPI001ED8ED98|nr:oligosaccharide flippase family protein [Pyrococcus furiosus]
MSRAVIARYFSTSEYGVFNLALTVLSIALVLATLGFQNSLPREVAFYMEREPSRVGNLILTALVIVTVNSLLITVLLILGSGFVAQVFREERLAYALKIVALALPFSALTGVMISISRGFGRVRGQVYFQNIVYPTLFMAFVVVGAFLKLPFAFVFGAYVAAWVLKLLVLTFDMWKNRILGFTTSSNSSTAFLSPLKYSINMPLSINSLVINLSLQFFC